MEYKNSKSESYVVREAEQIIENYIRDRELCDIENFYCLQEKYERLKILFIGMIFVFSIGVLLNIIF